MGGAHRRRGAASLASTAAPARKELDLPLNVCLECVGSSPSSTNCSRCDLPPAAVQLMRGSAPHRRGAIHARGGAPSASQHRPAHSTAPCADAYTRRSRRPAAAPPHRIIALATSLAAGAQSLAGAWAEPGGDLAATTWPLVGHNCGARVARAYQRLLAAML